MGTLSYSQISLYRSCPLCYKLQYIDGLAQKDKWYFSFGKTMHTCSEHFFRVRVPPPSLEEFLGFYDASWLSGGYDSPEEEEKHKAYGRQILSDFWEIHRHNSRLPLAVEKLFHIDIEGVKLRGFIDRVDKLDSGGLWIIDYKTDRELFTREDIENNLQLTLYQLAASQIWSVPVEKLSLYHLRSNICCDCSPRSQSQLEEARDLVLEVAGNIAEERFPATENQNCPCDFPQYCPYYRHKYVVELPSEAAPSIKPVEAVERYVALQGQIKALELELSELKQVLVSFCRTEGLSRVYGTEHAITCKMVERLGYDENAVRALLEPAGFWNQVLSFDEARLKGLFAGDALPADIRRRLGELKQVISVSPRLWVRMINEE